MFTKYLLIIGDGMADAASPGAMAMPAAAASIGERPVKYRRGSQPKIDRMAVSPSWPWPTRYWTAIR